MDPPELVRQGIVIPEEMSLYAILRHTDTRSIVYKQFLDVSLVLLSLIP